LEVIFQFWEFIFRFWEDIFQFWDAILLPPNGGENADQSQCLLAVNGWETAKCENEKADHDDENDDQGHCLLSVNGGEEDSLSKEH
jgi:hypothetical protein